MLKKTISKTGAKSNVLGKKSARSSKREKKAVKGARKATKSTSAVAKQATKRVGQKTIIADRLNETKEARARRARTVKGVPTALGLFVGGADSI
jgi:hypothetical protein